MSLSPAATLGESQSSFLQEEVWIFLAFKVENEITASFPEVKLALAICQLQVQLL